MTPRTFRRMGAKAYCPADVAPETFAAAFGLSVEALQDLNPMGLGGQGNFAGGRWLHVEGERRPGEHQSGAQDNAPAAIESDRARASRLVAIRKGTLIPKSKRSPEVAGAVERVLRARST